jgi:quinol monooxygenase YgiN
MNAVSRFARSLVVLLALQSALVHAEKAADKPLVVVVKVFPGAGREDELLARYEKQLEFLRKAEPNASFRLHRSAKEPVFFLWYETYPSQSALDNHLKVVMPEFRKEFGSTPEGLIARPSESETYLEIKN